MKQLGIILCLLCSFNFTWSQDAVTEYVDQYSSIAVSEMHRTSIPASIKLAQGILESNSGQSELARKSRNHFGIKCGSNWNGKSFYKEDDDHDRNGKLIPSCFRVYDNPESSFIGSLLGLKCFSKYGQSLFVKLVVP